MENSEKMLGAVLGSSFKCCMCQKAHSSLTAGYRAVHLCFAKLVDRAGIRSSNGRGQRKWSVIPEATFSHSTLGKAIFPELADDQALDLVQYRHFLAASTFEEGRDHLNGVIKDWKAGLVAKEKEMLAMDIPVPPFQITHSYGLRLFFGDRRELNFHYNNENFAKLLQDDGVAAAAVALVGHAHKIDVCWERLPEPMRLLVQLNHVNSDKGDPSGCYLISKEHRVQFVPVVCATVKEAEGRLGLR